MTEKDNYFKKEISYKFNTISLSFDVGGTLFSSFEIDKGTDALIRYCNPERDPKEILDIGCGYGPLGLYFASKYPSASVTLLDRDLLAVRYTNHNINKNNIKNAVVIGSIGVEEVQGKKFDLIVSNIPAKIGNIAIENDFILAPTAILNPGGEYWIVVVNANRYTSIDSKIISRRVLDSCCKCPQQINPETFEETRN